MIIGIVGFMGSGKDTCADALCEIGFKRDSFAKPLKDVVSIIFGWDRIKLEGTTKEDRAWREIPDPYWSGVFGKPFSPRLALQLMGTEAGRNVFGDPIWTASLLKRVHDDALYNYVITDVRFINEIEALHSDGALLVRVKRGPEPEYFEAALHYNKSRNYQSAHRILLPKILRNVHQSEWDWIGHPLIENHIENCGTLDDLKQKVLSIVPGQ